MDILISSNLERLLFDLSGCDGRRIAEWMSSLANRRHYEIGAEMLRALQARYFADYVSQEDVLGEIARTWREDGYLMDTHTAVALRRAAAGMKKQTATRGRGYCLHGQSL